MEYKSKSEPVRSIISKTLHRLDNFKSKLFQTKYVEQSQGTQSKMYVFLYSL